RDWLMEILAKDGIQTMIHYPVPPHMQKAYHEYSDNRLIYAERISEHCLSLPMNPFQSREVLDYICDSIRICQWDKRCRHTGGVND
ncbi:MAG: DegT/DnrJ/EryC1/StrS family aminotransferase, partial [Fermentimonas sp.]|nr:DegT/DnrJ/EryC1/StrS family aminotransferase [Fermentimonas sp.]